MSTAGIRSNRGDSYQTLVAFEWALTVLHDPEYEWIEIDSIAYPVDDIVVGKTDGTLICCQCKKNQTNFKAWTIADLSDELIKASRLLAGEKNAEVRFYSRSPFGSIAKLREHRTTQDNEENYRVSLSKEHQKTDADLAAILAGQVPDLSTYKFLHRTVFETSPELDILESRLHERLRYLVCNEEIAYDALWRRLDNLGSRMGDSDINASAQHRLTKDDLIALLHKKGVMLAPSMDLTEVRASFASTSAIGRSWRRDIVGKRILNPVLKELLEAIETRKRAILLTGLPGSGKTCVMLDLQEKLEQREQTQADIVPLFIQSREFADVATAAERQAQGLHELWVEKAARMAEDARVVVVVDSLDVLSIAREHSVLTYFLAQIDLLLSVQNITVITACRDFDRHYDRRIAERQWDCELKCMPLNWESQIAPLLEEFGIHTATIDATTRDLIRNPRELVLFVELAQQEGSFNIVNSQALAQRYLDTIVRSNTALGKAAMESIEFIATEMLKSRRLAVPHQRFPASQEMQRALCSLNVLQETQDGDLTFGHQSLLDVLVISGAVRRGDTLNDFIQNLPPVPFVRPSIRSFISQLAMKDRSDYRKQLRTVLTGSSAFHIRRLVAESLVEQEPQDGDWPLIRDLWNNHPEVFQVVYTQGRLLGWHRFWFTHLVPVLMDTRDVEGITAHARLVSQWINEDASGVLEFWSKIFTIDWMDDSLIGLPIDNYLLKIDEENLKLVAPLLEQLICMPRRKHSLRGRVIARCVNAGAIEDTWLWRYIAGDISKDDVKKYRFDKKLHCQLHEFGDNRNQFLLQRMKQSTTLLDLAVESIEQWSHITSLHWGNTCENYRSHFLSHSSYNDIHGQHNLGRNDSENILLDAIEAAILNHARIHSDWWQANRERLCFNLEGALRYFAILACTEKPEDNIDIIGHILRDKDSLESNLSFELGTLLEAAFIYLDIPTQDAVMACILALRENELKEEHHINWVLKKRAELIVTIPRYLRSFEAQGFLDDFEKTNGVLTRHLDISARNGAVSAPFSFEVFLSTNNRGVLRLMAHYSGYEGDIFESLVGGEEMVGMQLSEASSRRPTRFLRMLSIYWTDIPERFRDAIMDGVSRYLSCRYGNLRPGKAWTPLDEPDAHSLVEDILDELERHPNHWQLNRSASNALEGCANVIQDTKSAARLVFLAIGFTNIRVKSSVDWDSVNLITTGINMALGHVTEALMILANRLQEVSVLFPKLLSPTLRRFAGNENPAIRALILRRLPYLHRHNPEFSWDLFHRATQDAAGLWQTAEHFLYYTYHGYFKKVSPLLERIRSESSGKDMETWGRISALASLSGHLDISVFLNDLESIDDREAWKGAASVWTHHKNIQQHREQCLKGIEAGLNSNGYHAVEVAQKMKQLFYDNEPMISIPIELIHLFFTVLESDSENNSHDFFGYIKWINATSLRDSEKALAATEIYLDYANRTKSYIYDRENHLPQLMHRLFAEAEEREESDQGEMLHIVVSIQDKLLSIGVDGVSDWLKAAERP